ncbi:hypothetical protein AX16_002713 [Volvariella volvacea WC 439]|nr:hypothetical protein AX16_002713 [Volvariella volvacea WC 439]
MPPSAAPPSPQEIQRKLSLHSAAGAVRPSIQPVSGTESDSDSAEVLTPSSYVAAMHPPSSATQPPLSSIAERDSASGEDTDEEVAEEGGWKSALGKTSPRDADLGVIKSGYLWKKGERRKTWKKRWFVLRPAHIAYYKNSAEYKLLRLLELSDVHSVTQVTLKRRQNAFGLVSPVRTFYLQAKTPEEVQSWVSAIEDARQALLRANLPKQPGSNPIPIPRASSSHPPPPVTPSPPSHISLSQNFSSSESDDAAPSIAQVYDAPPPASPSKAIAALSFDQSKTILAGYLMKCGSKRRTWRKRWFVLTGEKLVYSGSHMDTRPHREFKFNDILDALEYDLPTHRHGSTAPSASTVAAPSDVDDSKSTHTFKIVTTKRALLLCAPSEEDEIKWLGAVRALIARRSATGIAPGNQTKAPPAGSNSEPSPTAVPSSSGGGIKPKGRRPSASGPALASPIPETTHE